MGVGGQRHAPAALPPVMTQYPLYRRLSRPQGRSGRVLKISPPPGFRSPDRPASSESLYRLSYRGPLSCPLQENNYFFCYSVCKTLCLFSWLIFIFSTWQYTIWLNIFKLRTHEVIIDLLFWFSYISTFILWIIFVELLNTFHTGAIPVDADVPSTQPLPLQIKLPHITTWCH
jgi:hypothetical protein